MLCDCIPGARMNEDLVVARRARAWRARLASLAALLTTLLFLSLWRFRKPSSDLEKQQPVGGPNSIPNRECTPRSPSRAPSPGSAALPHDHLSLPGVEPKTEEDPERRSSIRFDSVSKSEVCRIEGMATTAWGEALSGVRVRLHPESLRQFQYRDSNGFPIVTSDSNGSFSLEAVPIAIFGKRLGLTCEYGDANGWIVSEEYYIEAAADDSHQIRIQASKDGPFVVSGQWEGLGDPCTMEVLLWTRRIPGGEARALRRLSSEGAFTCTGATLGEYSVFLRWEQPFGWSQVDYTTVDVTGNTFIRRQTRIGRLRIRSWPQTQVILRRIENNLVKDRGRYAGGIMAQVQCGKTGTCDSIVLAIGEYDYEAQCSDSHRTGTVVVGEGDTSILEIETEK